jgi:PleD family two-component response regulator
VTFIEYECLESTFEFVNPLAKYVVVDDDETNKRAKELGADDFIRKPFSKRYLEEVVIKRVIELSRS